MINRSAATALILVFAGGAAHAYTIETHFTARCHERITSDAFRTARGALELPAPPRPTSDEQALIDDLQFSPDGDMKDLISATLLIGVRDNDLKGNSQDDLSVLPAIHGDPANQDEHCLRGPEDKEPDGTAAAIAACRSFIRSRILEALGGLDAAGHPDLAKRTSIGLHLSLRGHVDASLPTVYLRLGQALHAVQDSFTHTYRTPDGMKITVVLNWLDSVDGSLVESRDGPAHATKLDACDDPDELRKTRRVLATAASEALLFAALDARKTRDERMAGVDAILDTYLSNSPGCTFQNGWCDAPEARYKDTKNLFGCTTAPIAAWGAVALLVLAMRMRRKAAFTMLMIAFAGTARAAEVEPTTSSTTTTTPAKAATPTANPSPRW